MEYVWIWDTGRGVLVFRSAERAMMYVTARWPRFAAWQWNEEGHWEAVGDGIYRITRKELL